MKVGPPWIQKSGSSLVKGKTLPLRIRRCVLRIRDFPTLQSYDRLVWDGVFRPSILVWGPENIDLLGKTAYFHGQKTPPMFNSSPLEKWWDWKTSYPFLLGFGNFSKGRTVKLQEGINKLVVSTHLKNISQIGNLPQIGVKIKNL